jgi:superfamily II DNA or RNA helicase
VGTARAITRRIWNVAWEPGDRFEVRARAIADGSAQLVLPPVLLDPATVPEVMVDEVGTDIPFNLIASGTSLTIPEAASRWAIDADLEVIWLEYVSPHRYRLVLERSAPFRADPPSAAAKDTIEFSSADRDLLRRPMPRLTPAEFHLGLRATQLATHPGFDRLICLPMVREMELLEHQTRTAKTVLRRFRGRAMLCDEVGLGKTVEAGLVLSELLMRGLTRSVLVLTPPSLIAQWQGEMRRKFAIELTSYDDPSFRNADASAWDVHDRLIFSIHTAKREPHRAAILARRWDMVIVDEAHHLRSRTTAAWKFVSELQKQFILLLTATPVQNNLEELFNLVTLLEPGLLNTQRDFSRRFVSKEDKLTPRNVDQLHALLSEVMVRNRRSTVGLQFTRRYARTEAVALTPGSRMLYDSITAFVRSGLRIDNTAAGMNRMTLVMLQMAIGSSASAAASMLDNMLNKPHLSPEQRASLSELAEQARREESNAKADRVLQLLRDFPDKLVIFTQFRKTLEMLRGKLVGAGHDVAVFHGGLSRLEREAAIEHFRGSARLLLCSESGSEGRNLQFAHGLCNFDLPWNPMKIEQRVGRLSRIGQKSDVYVFNLVAAGTVEAAVLHLLEAKLNMFELVIGEIDMILGNLDEEKEFEEMVVDEWAASQDTGDFAARMETLGNRLLAAKAAYFRQRAQDEKLFGNRFVPEG